MSSTPILPISAPETIAEKPAAALAATAPLLSIVGNLSGSVRQSFSHCRPWIELADLSAFSRPASFSDATSRIRKNFTYFRANYLTVLAAVIAISIVSHPFSLLILLSLGCSWLFLYVQRPSDQPLVIGSRSFSDKEILGILLALTAVVIFFTSVVSLLVSGTLMGLGIVCAHGACRMPDDLFLDDQEASGSGFFPFFSGVAPSVAVGATNPAIMSHV
ncbi:hypothetical protein SLA2020_521320 [Shorea laevis]